MYVYIWMAQMTAQETPDALLIQPLMRCACAAKSPSRCPRISFWLKLFGSLSATG